MPLTHPKVSKMKQPENSGPAGPVHPTGEPVSDGPRNYQQGKRWGVRRPREHNGYIEEWDAQRGRYVYQHRLVVERSIGRKLDRSEVVHHVNGDKHDNRLENLHLHDSHSSHAAEHIAAGTWGHKGPRPHLRKPRKPCPVCGSDVPRKKQTTCSPSCGQTLRYNPDGKKRTGPRPCPICGKTFSGPQQTCSRSCGHRLRRPVPEHGNRSRYKRGCRCSACKSANAAWAREFRAKRKGRQGR